MLTAIILFLLKQLLVPVDLSLTTDSKKAWLYVQYQKHYYLLTNLEAASCRNSYFPINLTTNFIKFNLKTIHQK